MNTVAVIADSHGHKDELLNALLKLGLNPDTLELPKGLTVVHAGDLIHKGPQDREILLLVDAIMRINGPERWVQLVGNHEAQYVYGKLFEWGEELAESEAAILNAWLNEGMLHVAAAATSDNGRDTLITHAGVTRDVHKLILGSPATALEAATYLNGGLRHATPWVWEPGNMLGGGHAIRLAGPVWASAGSELYPSWMQAELAGETAPYHQIHGHSSLIKWPTLYNAKDTRQFADSLGGPTILQMVKTRLESNDVKRHTRIDVAGKTIIGTDPNHTRRPALTWEPFIFHGTAVAPAGQTPEHMSWLNEKD